MSQFMLIIIAKLGINAFRDQDGLQRGETEDDASCEPASYYTSGYLNYWQSAEHIKRNLDLG
jgi:hypothetical protein